MRALWLGLSLIGLLGGPCAAAVASIQEAVGADHHSGVHRHEHEAARTHAQGHGHAHTHAHGPEHGHHGSTAGDCCYALKASIGAGGGNAKPESPSVLDMVAAPLLDLLPAACGRATLRAIEPALRHQTSPPVYLATQRFRD